MFVVYLILGIVLLSLGATWLTDGASALAKRLGVSEFLIGVTIVALGTSMPELVVSVQSALAGQADVSIGNVVGSNVFNVFAILGLTTMIAPLALTRNNVRSDIPICIAASFLLFMLSLDGTLFGCGENVLSRIDGLVFLLGYVLFLVYAIRSGRKAGQNAPSVETKAEEAPVKEMKVWKMLVLVVLGICGLIFGADMFLDGAIELARILGLSEAVIGIVIVAAGTSLPELFASIVPAIKGKSEIALGNIIGSNIANILLILGSSATITPLHLGGITTVDMSMMLATAVMVMLSALVIGKNKITRVEGFIFFAIYVAYTVYLLR
jgi:cation:H+ antiporter